MIGMVLVTHGRLADEFVAAMEHVVGPQDQVRTICIGPDDDMKQRQSEIQQAAEDVNSGDGAILLTDMFGGTPSNLAIALLEKDKIEVVAGINLPMLIKLASVRVDASLDEAAEAAREAGLKYINIASQVLSAH